MAREFMSALASLNELRASREPGLEHFELPSLPTLEMVLARLPHLPPRGILIGLGSDGLPLMLDLTDPAPGPLLVLGDAGSGKTDLLRSVARALSYIHYPDEVQFCALTSRTDEWVGYEQFEHCRGIMEGDAEVARSRLADLVGQVRDDPARPAMLLLIDDPTSLHPEMLNLLHWLLQSGPAMRIWPLVALNAELAMEIPDWVARFRARIFGHIDHPDLAEEFAQAPGAALHNLLAGAQFTLRSEGHWLRFWVPL